MKYRDWFLQAWPFPTNRSAVLAGYRVLGLQHQKTLADIALRNHVLGEAPDGDTIVLAIAEGRRRCALEILKLANMDVDQLWSVIEKKPQESRT